MSFSNAVEITARISLMCDSRTPGLGRDGACSMFPQAQRTRGLILAEDGGTSDGLDGVHMGSGRRFGDGMRTEITCDGRQSSPRTSVGDHDKAIGHARRRHRCRQRQSTAALPSMATWNVNGGMARVSAHSQRSRQGMGNHSELLYHIATEPWEVIFITSTGQYNDATVDAMQFEGRGQWYGSPPCSQDGALSRSGVGILVKYKAYITVTAMHVLVQGRAIAIDVCGAGKTLRLVCVYAPVKRQALFFTQLQQAMVRLPWDGRVMVMAGDFNCCLALALDRPLSNRKAMDAGSTQLNQLVTQFSLYDTYRERHPTGIAWSYSQSRSGPGGRTTYARLDRIYVSRGARAFVCRATIDTSVSSSDHFPAVVTFRGPHRQGVHPAYRAQLHKELQFEESFQSEVTDLFNSANLTVDLPGLGAVYSQLMHRVYSIGVQHQRRLNRIRRDAVKRLQHKLDLTVLQMIKTPSDHQLLLQQDEVREELRTAECMSARRWLEGAGRASFRVTPGAGQRAGRDVKVRGEQTSVKVVQRPDGSLTTQPRETIEETAAFYTRLFACQDNLDRSMEENTENFTAAVKEEIQNRGTPVTYEESRALGADITPEEIMEAAESRKEKSCGLDGLPFWIYRIEEVAKATAVAVNAAKRTGQLPPIMTQVRVKLIPKGKVNLENLANWRPISLTATSYRLWGRVMANRLHTVLKRLIHPDQTAYQRGRYICSNILLARLVQLQLEQEQGCDSSMLSVDFKKAYDSVSYRYLPRALAAFGLGEEFSKWAMLVTRGFSARLTVDNELTPPLPLERGLRQGGTLSPLLFILMVEPLAAKIRLDQSVSGIPLNARYTAKVSSYSDDFTVYLQSSKQLPGILSTLDDFGAVSGLRINLSKCWLLPLGQRRDPPTGSCHGVEWIPHGTFKKYLGSLVGVDRVSADAEAWKTRIVKIRAALSAWHARQLSYRERAEVIHVFAVGSATHLSAFSTPTDAQFRQIDHMMTTFLWANHGHSKVAKRCLSGHSTGGVNLVNFRDKVKAMQSSWVVRYIRDEDGCWKAGFDEEIRRRCVREIVQRTQQQLWRGCRPPEIPDAALPWLMPAVCASSGRRGRQHVHVLPCVRAALDTWKDIPICVSPAELPDWQQPTTGEEETANQLGRQLHVNASVVECEWGILGTLHCSCGECGWTCPVNQMRRYRCRDGHVVLTVEVGSATAAAHIGVQTKSGRWAGISGHILHHRRVSGDVVSMESEVADCAPTADALEKTSVNDCVTVPLTKCTVKGVYWRLVEDAWQRAVSEVKWATIMLHQGSQDFRPESWWQGLLPSKLHWQVYNLNFELAHRISNVNHLRYKWGPMPAWKAAKTLASDASAQQRTATDDPARKRRRSSTENADAEELHEFKLSCRRCGAPDETLEHVVLKCPEVAMVMWKWAGEVWEAAGLPNDWLPDPGMLLLNIGVRSSRPVGRVALMLCAVRAAIISAHLSDRAGSQLLRQARIDCEMYFRYSVWLEWELINHLLGPASPSLKSGQRRKDQFESTWMTSATGRSFVYKDWNTFKWRLWKLHVPKAMGASMVQLELFSDSVYVDDVSSREGEMC